jgi:osmoprotectant transport system substrate-binding protein
MVYATDGGIAAASLVVLEDDKHDQPIYAPVPLIRATVLSEYPEIAALVKPVMTSLDRDTLQQLNERVQVDGESVQSVARSYLLQKGLLK